MRQSRAQRVLVTAVALQLLSSLSGCASGDIPLAMYNVNGEGATRKLGTIEKKSDGRYRIQHNYKTDPDRLIWFANPPESNPLIQTVPRTAAQIIRKSGKITIDITKDADIAKIQSGDVIQLEEGRYDTLPARYVDNVVFRGVAAKTSVGARIPYKHQNAWQPLQGLNTKGNRFWDIYFAPMSITVESGRAFFFNCRFENLNNKTPSYTAEGLPRMVVGLSHLGHLGFADFMDVDRQMNVQLFDSLNQRTTRVDDVENHHTEILTSNEFIRGPVAAEMIRKLSEQRLHDYVSNVSAINEKVAAIIQEARPKVLNEASIAEKDMKLFKAKNMQKEFYAELMRFLTERTTFKPTFDQPKIEHYMARTRQELKGSNYLVAYAMMTHAAQKYGALEHPPAKALIQEAEKAVGERYACKMLGSKEHVLRLWAQSAMPILNVSVPNSTCTITINNTGANETVKDSVTASAIQTRYEEYDPLAQYKEMMRAAAAREAEKAYMAANEASVDRMKDIARKMYDYRVRKEGDYLVYGQGNFGGNASAGTLAAQSQAQANSAEYAAKAAAKNGMAIKEIKETHETFFLNYSASVGVTATIVKKGDPSRKMQGPIQQLQWSYGPCNRKNVTVFDAATAGGKCRQESAVNGTPLNAQVEGSYYGKYVYPFFATFVAESVVPNVVKKIQQSRSVKDPGTKLESLLLTQYSNLGAVDAAEIMRLSQEVVGEPLTLDEYTDHLGIN